MTYFVDLSPYTYDDGDVIETDDGWITYRPRYERLNIGWIDAPQDFIKGPTPPWLPGALLDILAGPRINSMRGFHQCTFCPTPGARARSMIEIEHAGGILYLGHTEIRVPTDTGTMFAAPSLIWHYVTTHRYRPPDDFVEAVKNTITAGRQSQVPGFRRTPTASASTEPVDHTDRGAMSAYSIKRSHRPLRRQLDQGCRTASEFTSCI